MCGRPYARDLWRHLYDADKWYIVVSVPGADEEYVAMIVTRNEGHNRTTVFEMTDAYSQRGDALQALEDWTDRTVREYECVSDSDDEEDFRDAEEAAGEQVTQEEVSGYDMRGAQGGMVNGTSGLHNGDVDQGSDPEA